MLAKKGRIRKRFAVYHRTKLQGMRHNVSQELMQMATTMVPIRMIEARIALIHRLFSFE
jgi:hypothetical protein